MKTFSKILIPTDFSEHSNRAMEYAAALAREFGASIHMLHVMTVHNYDPFNPDLGFPEVAVDPTVAEMVERHLREMLGEAEPEITREVRSGFSPWHEITQCAADIGCDLIVMATHGRKGLEKLFLGSTAEKVVEHTPCPVLLLRPDEEDNPEPGAIHSILLPTDLSEESAEAAPLALRLADYFGAHLTIFHCVEQDVPPPYLAAGITSIFRLNEEILGRTREQLAKLITDEAAEELEHDFVIREGRSASEIVSFAREAAVDLIVMATHGYSGLEQALLGSTTDRVIRNTPCPVLVIRSGE